MRNKLVIDGKEIELSKETSDRIKSMLKEEKFEEIVFSEKEHDFLKRRDTADAVVTTWGSNKDINDFEYLEKHKEGQFWIEGKICPFEILDGNGDLICKSHECVRVRFLKKK